VSTPLPDDARRLVAETQPHEERLGGCRTKIQRMDEAAPGKSWFAGSAMSWRRRHSGTDVDTNDEVAK